ncbi:MAG: heme-binding domain-containing protein [bacterium]
MNKMLKRILLIVVGIIILVNLIPVDRTNPPVKNELKMPANVKAIIKKACYDCHSNETIWPLYSYVAPASWLVSGDVTNGRKHLNFSEWNTDDQNEALDEIWEEIEKNEMPLKIYTFIHSDAVLSKEEKTVIKNWIDNN